MHFLRAALKELLQSIIPAVLIALLLNMFVVQPRRCVREYGATLHKTSPVGREDFYRMHEPQRGERGGLQVPT